MGPLTPMLCVMTIVATPQAADAPPSDRVPVAAEASGLDEQPFAHATRSLETGLAYLRRTADERGGWMRGHRAAPTDAPSLLLGPVDAAVTAMGVKAFVQAGVEPGRDDVVRLALSAVLAKQLPDGRFDDGSLSTYVTATVISALSAMHEPALDETIAPAIAALKALQWDDTNDIGPSDERFGGFGYGSRGRPDLSNTQMAIEALHAACVGPEDESMQQAIVFLTRTQNLEATNEQPWVTNDGGFIYTPAAGGESLASEYAGEGRYGENIPEGTRRTLRSYGSMTYAGFKSLLHAGLAPDDPRVVAALDWIRANWTLDDNPGLGQQGWFYGVHALARAMRASGLDMIVDDAGTSHDWRAELVAALVTRQREDGSWRNDTDRWLEGHAELATIYAVLALEEAMMP